MSKLKIINKISKKFRNPKLSLEKIGIILFFVAIIAIIIFIYFYINNFKKEFFTNTNDIKDFIFTFRMPGKDNLTYNDIKKYIRDLKPNDDYSIGTSEINFDYDSWFKLGNNPTEWFFPEQLKYFVEYNLNKYGIKKGKAKMQAGKNKYKGTFLFEKIGDSYQASYLDDTDYNKYPPVVWKPDLIFTTGEKDGKNDSVNKESFVGNNVDFLTKTIQEKQNKEKSNQENILEEQEKIRKEKERNNNERLRNEQNEQEKMRQNQEDQEKIRKYINEESEDKENKRYLERKTKQKNEEEEGLIKRKKCPECPPPKICPKQFECPPQKECPVKECKKCKEYKKLFKIKIYQEE